MHPAAIFLVSGLPGTGKTTRSIELAERFGAVRMCPDDWMERLGIDIWDSDARARIETIQRDVSHGLVRLGTSVVIEWGLWTRTERDEIRLATRAHGGLVHLEFLDAPVDVLLTRIEERAREQVVGSRAITRDDLEAWSAAIERPTPDELAMYDPMPATRAADSTSAPTFPY